MRLQSAQPDYSAFGFLPEKSRRLGEYCELGFGNRFNSYSLRLSMTMLPSGRPSSIKSTRRVGGQAERRTAGPGRSGAIIVYTAFFIIILVAMAALAIEVGTMMAARTQAQAAADSAALAAASVLSQGEAAVIAKAQEYSAYHQFNHAPIELTADQVQIGFWDSASRQFTEDPNGNAVKVDSRIEGVSLALGSLLGTNTFDRSASAIAMAPCRDIAFVVDLSGSMNDDTEPAWATNTINSQFAGTEFEGVGSDLIQQLFDDFGYGAYPGEIQYIGSTLSGIPRNKYAYAEMTCDTGPLAAVTIPAQYRILTSDTETERKNKGYSYLIDVEIASLMPAALPVPDSSANYAYWEKYLDYVLESAYIHTPVPPPPPPSGGGGGGGSPPPPPPPPTPNPDPVPPALGSERHTPGFQTVTFSRPIRLEEYGTPPLDRGWLPPYQDSDRIYKFNNPNTTAYTSPDTSTRYAVRNQIGYLSYVQFMLDHGRDGKPDDATFVPLSLNSPHCPLHLESTAGGVFQFPPRSQPMHSCRRALIAALQIIKERNERFPGSVEPDQVAIYTFDSISNGVTLVQPLTSDYDAAMGICTTLQATIDKGRTTATEIGLEAARLYLRPQRNGGVGRNQSNKVVVLLTDGLPNDATSGRAVMDPYIAENPDSNFYGGGYYWLDAPIMHTLMMNADNVVVHPIGIGFGTDYDFMDRLARTGGTARGGVGMRGSGNPAMYEQRLQELFSEIIEDPSINLVK